MPAADLPRHRAPVAIAGLVEAAQNSKLIDKMDKLYQEEIKSHIKKLVMILPQDTFELLDAEAAMVQYKGLRVMWSNNTSKMKIITKDDFNKHHNMSTTIKLI